MTYPALATVAFPLAVPSQVYMNLYGIGVGINRTLFTMTNLTTGVAHTLAFNGQYYV